MLTDKFFIYSELLDEIFRKDVTYDNIKSRRKPWFHPPFRKQIFLKTTEGSQIDPPTPPHAPHHLPTATVLGLKFCSKVLNKMHPFHNGNGKTSKILLPNDGQTIRLIDVTKN